MELDHVLEGLYQNGMVPVIAIDNAGDAVPLAKAILAGGLDAAEITFRTPAAAEAIAAITAAFPEMWVGAGTVLTVEDAQRARDAGARFIVSPGYDPDVVAWCLEAGVPVLPGIATASEAQTALYQGLTAVKVYPAAQLGGPGFLRALSAVYPGLRLMPTGGVRPETVCDYLDVPNVVAAGGTWLCPKNLIAEGRFDEITGIIRDSVLGMFDFRLLHIGLNHDSPEEAEKNAGDFAAMFGLPLIEQPKAFFAGTMMEAVKKPFLGEKGHIGISTNYIDRAMAWFERRGYDFRPTQGERRDLKTAYFRQEIGGFAVHLRRKGC